MVLDDVNHIKHYRNFEKIQNDSRFEIIEKFDERFGWAIVKYNHPKKEKTKVVKEVLTEIIDDKPKKIKKPKLSESLAKVSKEAMVKSLAKEVTTTPKGRKKKGE